MKSAKANRLISWTPDDLAVHFKAHFAESGNAKDILHSDSNDDAIAAKRDTISANQAAWGGKVKYPGAYWADASSVPQMLSDRGHWYNQMVL